MMEVNGEEDFKCSQQKRVLDMNESVDDRERLIPFLKQEIINKIELQEETVYVKWPKDY